MIVTNLKFMFKKITHYTPHIIILILGFMLVVSVLNAKNDSLIFDEDAHIPAGFSYVTQHDMRLNPEHPPLLKDFAGLMLLPMHLKFDTNKKFWTTKINGQWEAGHNLLWQEGNNADQAIFWSRIPFILLSLLLGWFIFYWTKELAGTIAGLFALLLYAFDPNILGHNHFVTTDLGIAAFMTFSFYYFLRFIKKPSWKNVLLGGFFLGLVQLTKFSFITLFPIYGLVLIIYPLTKLNPLKNQEQWKFRLKKLGEYLGKGLIAFIVSLIIVWGVYFINIYKMPQQKLSATIEYYFPHNSSSISAVAVNKIANKLNTNIVGRPLSEYFLGIAMVFKRVDGGNGAYFMHQVSNHGFLAYFPTVFLLKEPLPSLFLMFMALSISLYNSIIFLIHKFKKDPSYSKNKDLASLIRHNIVSLSLFSFIILYASISISSNLNIGFRHLFPILPFIYILTAKVIFDFLKHLDQHTQTIWSIVIAVASIFLVAGTASAYPAYMSYFNNLAGGPKNGFHYVTDSNADWGQDLSRLHSWIKKYNWCPNNKFDSFCQVYHPQWGPINKIHIDYFGGADIHYYFGSQALDWWDSKRPIEPGWYAISTNFLMGSIYDKTKPDNQSYRWIKNISPVAQVGTSILIYYVTPQEATMLK